jgi:hypothetical protein
LILASSSFGTDNGWTSQNTYPRELAEINGDGRADIVAFGSNGVYVADVYVADAAAVFVGSSGA